MSEIPAFPSSVTSKEPLLREFQADLSEVMQNPKYDDLWVAEVIGVLEILKWCHIRGIPDDNA